MRKTWWDGAIAFAINTLELKPAEFWQLTLPELQAIISAKYPVVEPGPISRGTLQGLMNQYPDDNSRNFE